MPPSRKTAYSGPERRRKRRKPTQLSHTFKDERGRWVKAFVSLTLKQFCRLFCPCSCPKPKPKARLTLDVSTRKKFHLLVTPEPPIAVIDTGDIVPVFTSSDPTLTLVEPDDATPPNPLRCTVTTLAAGDSVVRCEAIDADRDPGEQRLLEAEFPIHATDAPIEATSASLALDGPVEDA
jgi:hypothetical protein